MPPEVSALGNFRGTANNISDDINVTTSVEMVKTNIET